MKKDDLYLLTAKLSKEEKTYISKRLSAFKENSVLKSLFEDICILYALPKQQTDSVLAEKYGRHYRTRKKQLYYTILKILRDYHHTLIHQIHFYMLDINLLFEKGLFEQARKLLAKAKKLAERNQIIPLYIELLYMELRMSYYTYYDNLNPEKITQIQQEFSYYHNILKEDIHWTLTTSEQLRDFFASGVSPEYKDYTQVSNPKGHLSFIQQHILAGLTYRNYLDFENSYRYRYELWDYFRKYPELTALYPELYLTAVNMVIIGTNDLGKYENSLDILDELSLQNIKADIARIEAFRIQATYYTQTHNFMQHYHTAYNAIENQIKNPLYHELHQIDRQLLHLHFAVSCIGAGDYHKAVYYCYQALNAEGNVNVMSLCVFLLLITHFAREDKEAMLIVVQQYKDLPFNHAFYDKSIRILNSDTLNTADIIKKLLQEYRKQDFKSRFVWEKYLSTEQLVKSIFTFE
jgi:hypothetical protein